MTAPDPTVQPNHLIPPIDCMDCGFPTLYVATIAYPDGTVLGTTLMCTHCQKHPKLARPYRQAAEVAGRDNYVSRLVHRQPDRRQPSSPMRRSA
jgi:hypothetical protein